MIVGYIIGGRAASCVIKDIADGIESEKIDEALESEEFEQYLFSGRIPDDELENIHMTIEKGIKCETIEDFMNLMPEKLVEEYSVYMGENAYEYIWEENSKNFCADEQSLQSS